jgi:hypothetical protein
MTELPRFRWINSKLPDTIREMKTFMTLAFAVVAAMSFGQCCQSKKAEAASEEAFMKMAREMEMAAEGKKACCKSTAEMPITKGAVGCCNAADAPKPFKVFVVGKGYEFFGCQGSASKGRQELIAKGLRVGQIQRTVRV